MSTTEIQTEDHHDDHDDHGDVQSTPFSKTIDIIYLTVIMLAGALFNLTIPIALKLEKRLRTSSNILFVNVVVADLVICLYILPLTVATRISERNMISNVACGINSFLMFVGMGVSNFSFMAIAVDRYIYIFHTNKHQQFVTPIVMGVFVSLMWIFWFSYGIGILLVLNGFDYEPDAYICFFADSKNDLTSAGVLACFHFLLPFLVAACSYITILIRTSLAHRRAHNRDSQNTNESNKMVIYLCITTTTFFLCWAPYTFHSFLIHVGVEIPFLVHKAMYWATLTNPTINGILYGPMNTLVRQTLVRKYKARFTSNQVVPLETAELASVSVRK